MTNRVRLTLILGLMMAILASACAPAAPGPKPLTKVRYGQIGTSIESFLPLMVAQEKGFLTEEGIEGEAILSRSGSEARTVFVAGDTDISIFGVDMASALILQGVDLRIIGGMTDSMAWALVALKDSGIKSVRDLKGKSLAVTSPGSLTHGVAVYALKQNGLDPEKDVSIIGVGAGALLLASLKAKKADAGILTEPFLSQGLEEGLADVIYDFSKELKGLGTSHFTAKKAYIDKNPEVVKAWLKAIDKGLKYVRSNKEDALQIARKEQPEISDSVVRKGFERALLGYKEKADYTKSNFEYEREVFLKIGFVKEMVKFEQVEYRR